MDLDVKEAGRRLVDPELLPLLDLVPTMELNDETLPFARENRFPLPETPGAAEAVSARVHSIPGPNGPPDVILRIYRPRSATGPLPCIFHIHGGGFVAGSAESMTPLHLAAAMKLDCMIASVDYRLAPEVRFPGAIEDCYAAIGWLFDQAEALGVKADRIGVMGESAGGGLAAALALLARDRGEYRLAFQHLIYPMLDDRTCVTSDPHPHTGQFVWTPQQNHFGWSALLGRPPGLPGVSPYAAPARADSLEGLPPSFISTGALDLFLEEDIDYARRLMRAGVSVELHVYPGGFHGFDFLSNAEVSQVARRDSAAALARALRPSQLT